VDSFHQSTAIERSQCSVDLQSAGREQELTPLIP